MRSISLLWCVAAVLGVLGGRAANGQTTVGGVIDQDTTWTLAASPYLATESVELVGGAVLTIEPGVAVAFEGGAALDSSLGVLIADGLGGDAIVLRSDSGEVGGWQGVVSSLDVPAVTTPEGAYVSGPVFRNVRIVEAVRAIEVGPTPNYFEDVEIERCSEAGVVFLYYLDEAMWVKDVAIRDANEGVRFRGGTFSRLVLHDCIFEDNIGGGIQMGLSNGGTGEMLRCTFRGNGGAALRDGGGGAALAGSWDIRDCVFEQNETHRSGSVGGGLLLATIDSTITDSDFLFNTSDWRGGGADVQHHVSLPTGAVRIERCRFIGNTSERSSGAGLVAGGALSPQGYEATILDCTFEENHGDNNGGLALGVFRGEVTGCAFTRNSARRSGGAIRVFYDTNTLEIRDNEFIENSSQGVGGAIDLAMRRYTNKLRIEANTFRDNSADTGGAIGGIGQLSIEIVGNTFDQNTARLGGAVHVPFIFSSGLTLAAEGDLHNRFTGNTADVGSEIYNDSDHDIDATGNCWGTGDLAAIADRIYDASDDPTKGAVAFDPIATDCACPADLDADGELTIFDFLAFQNLFDLMDPRADFDGDGEFTIFDFLAFQNAFDAGCD